MAGMDPATASRHPSSGIFRPEAIAHQLRDAERAGILAVALPWAGWLAVILAAVTAAVAIPGWFVSVEIHDRGAGIVRAAAATAGEVDGSTLRVVTMIDGARRASVRDGGTVQLLPVPPAVNGAPAVAGRIVTVSRAAGAGSGPAWRVEIVPASGAAESLTPGAAVHVQFAPRRMRLLDFIVERLAGG